MKRLKILAVVPYAELGQVFFDVKDEFPDIDLSIYHGYSTDALKYIDAFPGESFDAIISRGGTATTLSEQTDLPVIKLRVSELDILDTLNEAQQLGKKIAFCSYSNVTECCRDICRILNYNIHVFTMENDFEQQMVDYIAHEHFDVVIGGVFTVEELKGHCGHTILLRSHRSSVRNALAEAVSVCRNISSSIRSGLLFRDITDQDPNGILVFDENKQLCYANQAVYGLNTKNLEQRLRRLLPALAEQKTMHFVKQSDLKTISIHGNCLSSGNSVYYVFHIFISHVSSSNPSIMTIENTTKASDRNTILFADRSNPLFNALETAANSRLSVLLVGPEGCGKPFFARYLHRASNSLSSFITIHCAHLTPHSWAKILKDLSSPLHAVGYTLFFQNIHELSLPLQKMISEYIHNSALTHRNRVISSSPVDLTGAVVKGQFSDELYQEISGITIRIPSLNQRRTDIPAIVNSLILQYNLKYSKSIISIEPEAMDILCKYSWQLDFEQLDAVVRQLVILCSRQTISTADLESLLSFQLAGSQPSADIDLSGTLEQIELRVIHSVLKSEQMNLSATAKRLGISRSTLWRKLHSPALAVEAVQAEPQPQGGSI